jgi:hypothetical protein
MPEDYVEPAEAPFRRFRLRGDFGMGFFHPTDVKNFIKSRNDLGNNGSPCISDESCVVMTIDLSAAYYVQRYLGIRMNLAMLVPDLISPLMGPGDTYSMGSFVPGLALDFVRDKGGLARYFISPGLEYHWASFQAHVPSAWKDVVDSWDAHGLGLELAVGAELSFGPRRKAGLTLALVARRAKLDVSGRPDSPPVNSPAINTLDFSSVLLVGGFQLSL